MNSKVKVVADEAGNIIRVSKNNPEWGHILVEQTRRIIDENNFIRTRRVSALIHGKVDELKDLGWVGNQELPGKIVVKERLEPFNVEEPERDYKIAGETKIVCCYEGMPIYRKAFYTENLSAFDETQPHTNGEEIAAAYKAKEGSSVSENADFDRL